jgi:HYR domain
VELQVEYLNNCGLIEICAIATGSGPYSYQWCSGESNACLVSQLTPCVPTEFCVSVTCSDGTVATATQVYTVQDSTPPVITCPANATVQCGNPTTPAATGTATGTDACGTVTITSTDVFVSACGNTGVITRTWRATDACGNTATCNQIITIIDSTPPGITCAAQTTPISCPATPVWVAPTATDACSTVPPVITFMDVFVAGTCPGTGTHTRTWRATDACNNTATCSRSIVVQDVTPPVITCAAQTTPINCPATPVWVAPTATDNCDATPTITFVDAFVAGACAGTGTHTRTWTATDDCGNTATCSRSIVVQDVTAPVITCAAQTTPINCPATPVWVAPTATDACSTVPPVITFVDVFVAGACPGTGTHTRTWRATVRQPQSGLRQRQRIIAMLLQQ